MDNEQGQEEEVVFTPTTLAEDEFAVTESAAAESDIKTALDAVDGIKPPTPETPPYTAMVKKLRDIDAEHDEIAAGKVKSDGSTAKYYELPEDAKELQDLISFKNMNAQMGEIGRAWYRYGQVAHSEKLRDAKKIKYYIEAEIARLEKYGD